MAAEADGQLCPGGTSFRLGENAAESDGTGGDRDDIVIEEGRNENAKYGEN
jgi:hypothetical protein